MSRCRGSPSLVTLVQVGAYLDPIVGSAHAYLTKCQRPESTEREHMSGQEGRAPQSLLELEDTGVRYDTYQCRLGMGGSGARRVPRPHRQDASRSGRVSHGIFLFFTPAFFLHSSLSHGLRLRLSRPVRSRPVPSPETRRGRAETRKFATERSRQRHRRHSILWSSARQSVLLRFGMATPVSKAL